MHTKTLGVYVFTALLTILVTSVGTHVSAAEKLPSYSPTEQSLMFRCVAKAENVKTIAEGKINGLPATEFKSSPTATDEVRTAVDSLVDKIYADSYTSAWDYSLRYFMNCAFEEAKVSVDRLAYAGACTQNTLIAGEAVEMRSAGKSRKEVLQHFAFIPGSVVENIVTQSYNTRWDHSQAIVQTWTACMLPRLFR